MCIKYLQYRYKEYIIRVAREINITALNFMKQKFTKGFTLIELLVVIAIIGVLSAVVLTQTNSARLRASDAQRKSNFKNFVSAAALFYDNFGNYNNFCVYDTNPFRISSMVQASNANCQGTGQSGYRIYTTLSQTNQFSGSSGTDYLCTDTRGNVVIMDNIPTVDYLCQ